MKVSLKNRLTSLLAICLCILVVQQTSHAQGISLFKLYNLNGSLQFKYLNENRIEPFKSGRPYFKETLTLRNKGYIVSPKILDFEWGIVLGLTQDRYHSQTFNRKTNGKFLNGFFTGTFFKKNAYPLTAIWNRTNQNFVFNYGGYTSYKIEKFQLSWVISRFYVPGLVWAERRTTNENWYQINRLVQRKQTRYVFNYSGSKKYRRSSLNLRYKARKVHDFIYKGRSYVLNNAFLRYQYFLNAPKTDQWSSEVTYYDRQNEIRYRLLRTQQMLRLKHRFGLQSNYSYNFSAVNTLGYRSYLHSAYTSLQHQLFQSLTSYASLSGSYNRMNNGKDESYAFSRGVNYNKNLPLEGKLQLGYKLANGKTDRTIRNVIYKKVAEQHMIINDTPVFLDETNIITGTIVVYNKEGDIIYEPGESRDYTIFSVGNQVQIMRTPFSRIEPEQVVLVDYQFRTAPSMKYTTSTEGFNAGLYFRWFSVYYRFNKHRQNLLRGQTLTADFLQNLYFRTRGIKAYLRGQRAGLTFLLEQKKYEGNKLAYDLLTLSNNFFLRPNSVMTLVAKLNYHRMHYDRLKRTTTIYSVNSEWNWYPTSLFSWQLFGTYRFQEDPVTKTQLNAEYGGYLLWQWSIMRLKVYYARQYWKYVSRNIRINRLSIEIERYF